MSIGIVLRHTYEETCEICDKIAEYIKAATHFNKFFTRVGYARPPELARQGYYEEKCLC